MFRRERSKLLLDPSEERLPEDVSVSRLRRWSPTDRRGRWVAESQFDGRTRPRDQPTAGAQELDAASAAA